VEDKTDVSQDFKKALAVEAGESYVLKLYVTGITPRSLRAIQNIRALCEENLKGRYELEVVDVYQCPEQVRADQIIVTPTLIKRLPEPVRRLLGDLSNEERVLLGLDMVPRGGEPES
jgi:circadian clock protein KaiB